MAKTRTHAAGHWTYERSPGFSQGDHEWFVYAPDAEEGRRLPAICDTEANARLVAMAPELLETCRIAQDAIYEHGAAENHHARRAMHALQTAIAKATGR